MARGIDTRLSEARRVGPGSSLHARIRAESNVHQYLFGQIVGTQDDGQRTLKRPAPVGGDLEGAPPNAIKLVTLRENHRTAMSALMEPAPTNDRPVEGLRDVGLGRLSTGEEFPVKSWVDESIKKR